MSQSAKKYTPEQEAEMRAKGLVPKTVWVFDVDAPGFAEESRRQSTYLVEAAKDDPLTETFSDADLDLPPYEEGDLIRVALPGDTGKPSPALFSALPTA